MALHTKLLLVAGLVPLVAAADSLRLLHRIYSPSAPSSDFFERATLDPRGGALQSAPSFASDLLAFAQTTGDVSDALYQVALAPSSNAEAPWLISSVRAVSHTHCTRCPLGSSQLTRPVLRHSVISRIVPMSTSPSISHTRTQNLMPSTTSSAPCPMTPPALQRLPL
ncbi:hypothetical protein BV25DRAFT_1817681 [Artomyces pyxidatus]|uniref:Uncharacterized protein n=1 Tax=Artomyces pyxidatus TaxID=48021 RepID=A0ACB8TK14_9AGAM|nr:hypothetical protein BV25DRAFT_1817681 [Artomyces pyxidatus]